MSVALQMLAYGGQTEGLFRGAFMQSGAPIPVSDLEKGQVSSLITYLVQSSHSYLRSIMTLWSRRPIARGLILLLTAYGPSILTFSRPPSINLLHALAAP